MRQTAVEWLIKEWFNRELYYEDLKQAKEFEKDQLINFANNFYDDCVMDGGSLHQSAEEYYNKIFKTKEK